MDSQPHSRGTFERQLSQKLQSFSLKYRSDANAGIGMLGLITAQRHIIVDEVSAHIRKLGEL
jgi:hypothetical protein